MCIVDEEDDFKACELFFNVLVGPPLLMVPFDLLEGGLGRVGEGEGWVAKNQMFG